MKRYFLEVAYKGTQYAGFQVQHNSHSVQGTIDKAVSTLMRIPVQTTGSSRTDAGVHALQNFLHFDTELPLHPQFLYKVNAILPPDIVLKGVYAVPEETNARFAAESRSYQYFLYNRKDPFRQDRGYYFPYKLDEAGLQEAATIVSGYTDFSTFSKRNSQVKTYNCNILHSYWSHSEDGQLIYNVRANRFLRGMVRGLVGTMLRVGRGKLSIEQFHEVIQAKDCTKADFAVPPQGLFLVKVQYPDGLLQPVEKI